MTIIVILVVIILIVFWVIGIYNRIVSLRNRRQNAFADINVQLRQRHQALQ